MDEEQTVIIICGLRSQEDLSTMAPVVQQQLHKQGTRPSNSYRYEVAVKITEGRERPARDVDNYAKKTLDAITNTKLLWADDEQIDKLNIVRIRDMSRADSQVVVKIRRSGGQHSGIPSSFRACCDKAKLGGLFSYADAGKLLASHLRSEQPFDLDERDWSKRIARLYDFLEKSDDQNVWNWFCEHLPKCMKLVPNQRMSQFVRGVKEAYTDGKMDE